MRVGTPDVVEPGELGPGRLVDQVVGPHRVHEALRTALLRCTVVAHDHHERVVEPARPVEEIDEAGQFPIGVVEHRRVGGLQPLGDAALVGREIGPGLHPRVPPGQDRPGGDDAPLDHAGEAPLAGGVPPVGEPFVVVVDQLLRRLVRGVARARGDVREPRHVGRAGLVLGEHPDGFVDEVGGQVIAVGVGARGRDLGVVAHQLGRVLIGLGIEEAVEAVEAPGQRPAVGGTGRARLVEGRDMPLAGHVGAVAVGPQHLGDRARAPRDLPAVAGEPAVEVGETTDPHAVVVAARQQRGPGRRAHRGGVEARVTQAAGGEPVDGGRRRVAAVAAEVGEAHVVEEDQQDVGGAVPRSGRIRPVRGRLGDGAPDDGVHGTSMADGRRSCRSCARGPGAPGRRARRKRSG